MSSLKAVVDTFILQKMMQKNLSSFSCLELADNFFIFPVSQNTNVLQFFTEWIAGLKIDFEICLKDQVSISSTLYEQILRS